MARKKKVEEEILDLPEFGFIVRDDDGVILSIESNSAKDKHKYLENAKTLKRPILISIESDIFDSYKFKNFALTKDEARMLMKELSRMLEYLEE